jgi:hypothetical protein
VVGEADGGRNGDFIEPCGSGEDANEDFVELRSRAEQEASVDGAAGDLEERRNGMGARKEWVPCESRDLITLPLAEHPFSRRLFRSRPLFCPRSNVSEARQALFGVFQRLFRSVLKLIPTVKVHYSPSLDHAARERPSVSRLAAGGSGRRGDYPPTKGSAGGKQPRGNTACRSPARRRSAAVR